MFFIYIKNQAMRKISSWLFTLCSNTDAKVLLEKDNSLARWLSRVRRAFIFYAPFSQHLINYYIRFNNIKPPYFKVYNNSNTRELHLTLNIYFIFFQTPLRRIFTCDNYYFKILINRHLT